MRKSDVKIGEVYATTLRPRDFKEGRNLAFVRVVAGPKRIMVWRNHYASQHMYAFEIEPVTKENDDELECLKDATESGKQYVEARHLFDAKEGRQRMDQHTVLVLGRHILDDDIKTFTVPKGVELGVQYGVPAVRGSITAPAHVIREIALKMGWVG